MVQRQRLTLLQAKAAMAGVQCLWPRRRKGHRTNSQRIQFTRLGKGIFQDFFYFSSAVSKALHKSHHLCLRKPSAEPLVW